MNCILLYPEEITEGVAGRFAGSFQGHRAQELIARHDLRAGISIQGALLGVGLGSVAVLEVTPESLRLDFSLEGGPLDRVPVDLVVGVSRPPTMKRVIHSACALGVERLILVRADGSDKSYLMSRVLELKALHHEVELALEQACDAVAPIIIVLPHPLVSLRDDELPWPSGDNTLALVADTYAQSTIPGPMDKHPRYRLYIGPERGWSPRERQYFAKQGIQAISLGPRMLRVETALVYLLGKLP